MPIVREFTACQGSEDALKETGTQAEGRKCQAQVHRRCYVLSVARVPGHRGGGRHFRWSKEHQMCGVEVSSDLAPLWENHKGVFGSLPFYFLKSKCRDFPGSPVVKTLHLQCTNAGGRVFDPCLEN